MSWGQSSGDGQWGLQHCVTHFCTTKSFQPSCLRSSQGLPQSHAMDVPGRVIRNSRGGGRDADLLSPMGTEGRTWSRRSRAKQKQKGAGGEEDTNTS